MSMPANYVSWAKMVEQEHAWAEGPVWQRMLYIDELDDVKPGSRDLALEAFEDGHPHVVSEVRFDEYSEERI